MQRPASAPFQFKTQRSVQSTNAFLVERCGGVCHNRQRSVECVGARTKRHTICGVRLHLHEIPHYEGRAW